MTVAVHDFFIFGVAKNISTKYNQKLKIYYSGPVFPIVYSFRTERKRRNWGKKKTTILSGQEAGERRKEFSIASHWNLLFSSNRIEWQGKPALRLQDTSKVSNVAQPRISNSTIPLAQTWSRSPVGRHKTQIVGAPKKGEKKLSRKHEIKMKRLSKNLTQSVIQSVS